ncbi:MAG TPA: calcium-translocating P-type ATPase, PMCA-type [Candidatus Pelethosoma merdigallinarum]|nr:calcium-translocating P-type ATPase, PMCA-type [Candidatus Pelethosoma merdigallinarum]
MNNVDITFGLDKQEVEKNREKYGSNQITINKQDTFLKLLLESFGDPIIRILLIALGIKLVFLMKDFDWFETVGIVIAIFLASFISTLSEYGSEQAFAKLQEESSKTKCRVRRHGKVMEINIDEVVTGDIVLLESGDKIPADGVLVRGTLSVDESSLNGETKEAYKDAKKEGSKNSVYRGTVVYSGQAIMKVKKVGDQTFYGKLASELQEKQPESPLKLRLRSLAKTISFFGYCGAILVVVSYLFSTIVIENQFDTVKIMATLHNFPVISGHILYALTLAVTIIVVSVPEGLPMMITLVLSSNMKRMLKNNVLVRKLVGIETAGSLNILFTDKTGTLTKGKLEVIGVTTSNGKSYRSLKELKDHPQVQQILTTSLYYNNESLFDEQGKILGGNITDRALLRFTQGIKPKPVRVKKKIPFDSKRKYSMTLIEDGKPIYLVKGAPEKLLGACTSMYDEWGSKKPFTTKNRIRELLEATTKQGIRVILLATSERETLVSNLTFVGLVFIKDEIRPEAKLGVEEVTRAHIQTVMITGDNKDTAMAIAKEVGLLKNSKDVILTSDELKEMSDYEVKRILPHLRVVARSLPQDKSRLVRISQELGLVVGMTGDGVNDAPALKKADVGFSMGSGTEVSKEASDIIILDDNFNSISKSILFGRTIFKSIRKFIIFQLTVNVCAVSLSIIGPFIGVDTPVTVIQMLWINMVMDTFAGLAFAFEPPLPEYMDEYPKKKNEQIMNRYMKGEIFFTGLYSSLLCIFFLKSPWIHSLFRPGEQDQYLLTAFFGLFIFIGIFNCFNARTHRLNLLAHLRKNMVFVFIILFIIVVQLILIYYGGDLFRTAGLTFKEFVIMLMIAVTVIPVDWFRKIYLRTKGQIGGV